MGEYSNLYTKTLYRNKSIPYLFSRDIIEYDISSAGYNLTIEYNLLDKDRLDKLHGLSKKERHYKIGWYQKKDKKYAKELNEAFTDIRKRFFKANNIQDEDIIAIKKDAIFCNRFCNVTEFNNVKFVEKNRYTSYLYLADCEIYYNYRQLDIKNIDDAVLTKHDDYIKKYISMCIKHFETSPLETQLRFMRRFIDKYKSFELELGYYRPFDKLSLYSVNGDNILYDDYWYDKIDELDISYNFSNVLIPLFSIAI